MAKNFAELRAGMSATAQVASGAEYRRLLEQIASPTPEGARSDPKTAEEASPPPSR